MVEDFGDLHQRAWEAVAAEEGKSLPPLWMLRRADGMKNEQVGFWLGSLAMHVCGHRLAYLISHHKHIVNKHDIRSAFDDHRRCVDVPVPAVNAADVQPCSLALSYF